MTGPNRWMLWIGILTLSTLLAMPAAVAAQEDTREQPAPKPAGKNGKAGEDSTSKDDAKSDEKQASGENSEEPVAHPSFNTFEDIVAYRGSVASLWTDSAQASPPAVTWQDVDPACSGDPL